MQLLSYSFAFVLLIISHQKQAIYAYNKIIPPLIGRFPGKQCLTASPFTCGLRHLKSPSNLEHRFKKSSSSELSIGCIIAHLPSSSPAPSPSLSICPSPPSAPFYAQNKSERTHGWRRKQEETIDNSFGSSWYLDFYRRQHARRTVRYR